MKTAGISAAEALAAIDRERQRYHKDPHLVWPSHDPSPPQPGVCPNDRCFSEHNNIVTPTRLRIREDGRATCRLCGYVDQRRTFPYQPDPRRVAVLPDWMRRPDPDE